MSRSRSRSPNRRVSGSAGRSPSPARKAGRGVIKSDLGYASLNPLSDTEMKKLQGMDFNAHSGSILGSLVPLLMMMVTPVALFYLYMSCAGYQCAFTQPATDIVSDFLSKEGSDKFAVLDNLLGKAYRSGEMTNVIGLYIYLGYVAVQAVLAVLLPGKQAFGQTTPGGIRWEYNINGVPAFFVSVMLYFYTSVHLKLFSPSIFYDHWLSVIFYANAFSLAIVLVLYFKACVCPSYGPNGGSDVNFSGNFFNDLYKGVELNPRIYGFDIKLFCVSRVGMLSWAFVNLAAAFKQYELTGSVTNAMVLINIMQFFYIYDLLAREEWYLSTIDIMLDRAGFYIIWGVCAWVPVWYCMQSLWLIHNPVTLSWPWFTFALCLHLAGYTMFLDSNTQRVRFREEMKAANNDDSKVSVGYLFGKCCRRKPKYVEANWIAGDGEPRTSLLLTSGYWGWARHFNYLTDLMMCFAWGMSSGSFNNGMPWAYFFFMVALLGHRAIRDERRMATKYGKDYLKYKRIVSSSIIPGIF